MKCINVKHWIRENANLAQQFYPLVSIGRQKPLSNYKELSITPGYQVSLGQGLNSPERLMPRKMRNLSQRQEPSHPIEITLMTHPQRSFSMSIFFSSPKHGRRHCSIPSWRILDMSLSHNDSKVSVHQV